MEQELIEIIKADFSDLPVIQTLGKLTFAETFSDSNTEADMQHYLETSFTPEKMATELSNPDSEFYLAKLNDEAVGYLKVNSDDAQTELKEKDALEIERIYVLNAFQGRKIGQLLYEKALEIALKRKVKYLWLGVWEKNLKAIRFYKRNGFYEFDRHIFKLGEDIQTDLMMRVDLRSDK